MWTKALVRSSSLSGFRLKGNAGAFGCSSFLLFYCFCFLLFLTFLRFSAVAIWSFGKCPVIAPFSVMCNSALFCGLLFLLVSFICEDLFFCWDHDLHGSKTSAAEDSLLMALRYTARNLLKLKRNYLSNDTYELCQNVGILRPP